MEDQTALSRFKIRPCGFREAIAAALKADGSASDDRLPDDPRDGFSAGCLRPDPSDRRGNRLVLRELVVATSRLLDRLFGGFGVRRGRRDPNALCVGDTVDFWRVEAMEPDHRLRLAAEMKLPGRAWLEFEVTGDSTGSVIRQTATFDPDRAAGPAYWYSVFPLHRLVFSGMLHGIAAKVRVGN